MLNDRPFSPGSPIAPFEGYSTTPRSHDFQTGYNIAARPRRNERVAFDTLKGLIDAYDVAQMCIWHRINSIRSLKWSLVAMPGWGGVDLTRAQELGYLALKKPDRRRRFKPWLTEYLYDVLAYDAGALFRIRNGANRAIGLKVIDGTTIAPLLDDYGDIPMRRLPDDPAPPAYVQYAQGVPWTWLTDDDLIYEPYQSTSSTPYGKAPIETILLNANTDLRFQAHFISRFTEGNVPEAFATSPEGWSPDQITEFQDAWDAFLLGDEAAKHQIKWVPHDTTLAWSREEDFSDTFSLFLMRKTAAAYHVTPQDLGFTEDVNRATSETQVDNQFRIGDLPLTEHIEGILDSFLQDDLGLPLCFEFDTGQEKEDRLATAQADKIYVEMGAIGVSEVRERTYGLSEPDGVPVPRYIMTSRSGPVPLNALKAVAGAIDPESGAPAADAVLPHSPFQIIEGVTPTKPDTSAATPLAAQVYPADNQAELQTVAAAQPGVAAPVVKGEGAGVTVDGGTVATSYDLVDDDEDDEAEVAKAAEMATFARFARSRRTAGRWRDFQFTSVNAVEAHRLNVAGRVSVRKAAGLVIAAGLAVQAVDTSRVLMLQRGLNPSVCGCGEPIRFQQGEDWLSHADGSIGCPELPHADPAEGTWEFPGGHIEGDESALDAAIREWQEETGCLLPEGEVTGGWASENGIYEGFLWTIPSENQVPIFERGAVTNPDDPDGDSVEALAWWEPRQLGGALSDGQFWRNPALRSELQASIPALLDSVAAALDSAIAQPESVVKAGGVDPKA